MGARSARLSVSVEARRQDEIGELAQAMHDMSEALRSTERERAQRETDRLRSANTQLELEVAERQRAQAERETLIAELEAKASEMEQFTYTVSHDLKSPLVTITGFLREVQKSLPESVESRVRDDLDRIFSATDRMQTLLDDLVEISRIGRLTRPRERVDLTELAGEALELLSGPLGTSGVDARIETDLPVVVGERDRLLEVFQNLIENAAKFSSRQEAPRIRIGAETRSGETICYVRDNGIGIDPQHQEKVFGIFTQLSPDYPGTGIGLALVKRIIEAHDGRIWAESEGEGTGARFCFTIPPARGPRPHPHG